MTTLGDFGAKPTRVVPISDEQLGYVKSIMEGRQNRAKAFGRVPKYGQSHDWGVLGQDNLCGVVGEFAVASFFGIHYDGNGEDPDDTDVGGCQVRSTYHQNGKLILHDGEEKDRIYILVTITSDNKSCRLAGWTNGQDVLNGSHWGDHFGHDRPCYAMSQSELRPISSLMLSGGRITCVVADNGGRIPGNAVVVYLTSEQGYRNFCEGCNELAMVQESGSSIVPIRVFCCVGKCAK